MSGLEKVSKRIWLATILALLVVTPATSNKDQSSSSTDHCFTNLYENSRNSTFMQFSKEVVSMDYAILGSFKSLHCCSKGYRSIEWMKDGKPYPWKSDISSLIVYPEASNQTIYTRQVQTADVGNYTCVLRNDTHKITHHIMLNAQGPDLPLATYHPRDQQAELGQPARFYCEAFVGNVELPDVKSEISWYHVKDGLEEAVDGTQVFRENRQNIGSYLKIPQVQDYHYGRYLCRVEFNSEAHRLEMYATLFSKPIMTEIGRKFALYQTLAAIISAIIAAIVVLGIWCLLRPWWLRRNSGDCKNLCHATSVVSSHSNNCSSGSSGIKNLTSSSTASTTGPRYV